MKQTEVTVQVFNSLQEIETCLLKIGFKKIEKKTLKDFYFISELKPCVKEKKYIELINNSIILRNIIEKTNSTFLVYKEKVLDKNNNVVSEEKTETKVENFEKALKIFEKANLKCWCDLSQNLYIYKKEDVEIAVQEVEGLGIFIEYEESIFLNGLSDIEKFEKMVKFLKELDLKLGNDFSCKKVYMKYKNNIRI